MMVRIIQAAESGDVERGHTPRREAASQSIDQTEVVARAAAASVGFVGAQAIACFTRSGRSALQISKHRPDAKILAFTPEEETRRKMALYWGVVPRLLPELDTIDEMIREVDRALVRLDLAAKGDPILLVAGALTRRRVGTNMMMVHVIGETEK